MEGAVYIAVFVVMLVSLLAILLITAVGLSRLIYPPEKPLLPQKEVKIPPPRALTPENEAETAERYSSHR